MKKTKPKEPSLSESFRESFENPTFILASVTVGACVLRFLFDGLNVTLFGQNVIIPHTDSMSYGAILTPVLAAHGYLRGYARTPHSKPTEQKVDNPENE